MSERHISKHEEQHSSESLAEHKEQLDALRHEKHEQAERAKQDQQSRLEKARQAAEQHAEHSKQVGVEDTKSQLSTFGSHQLLKKDAYKQLLKRTQKKLSKPSRTFSKFIHKPTIESVSEITGKTLARPSGLLGGGVGAFIGSATLLFTARHYGFTYNYSLFILLFVGGFLAGVALEFLLRLIKPSKH